MRVKALYFLVSISWLGIAGMGAMNLRTYLLNSGSIKFDEVYYLMLTLHGDAGMMAFVAFASISLLVYLEGEGLNERLLLSTLIASNAGLLVYFLGGPIVGWYMLYPLSVQGFNFIGVYGKYFWLSYVGLMVFSASMEVASLHLLRRSKAVLTFATSALMSVAMPFLFATSALYVASATLKLSLSPLLTASLFWEYASPDTYFLTYAVFATVSVVVRPFSERWLRWSKYPLVVLPMLVFANHLQTWPIPVAIRDFSDYSTLVLSGFLALLFVDFALPLGRPSSIKEFLAGVTLIGFALSSILSLVLPFEFSDPAFHNTYYVVGSFHAIVLDFLVTGFFFSFFLAYGKEERLIRSSMLVYVASATALSYLMAFAGYEGLIRREVIFPGRFFPYMYAMSGLAFVAVSSISLSFAVVIGDALSRYLKEKGSIAWVDRTYVAVKQELKKMVNKG